MENQEQVQEQVKIKHKKEIHSFYLFIILVSIGLLVLQPITMVLAMILSTKI